MDHPSDPVVPRLRDITALPDLLHGSSRAGPVRERRQLRYRGLSNTNPAEADRLGVLALEAVDQRWSTYEEMATRGAQRFPADARKDD